MVGGVGTMLSAGSDSVVMLVNVVNLLYIVWVLATGIAIKHLHLTEKEDKTNTINNEW